MINIKFTQYEVINIKFRQKKVINIKFSPQKLINIKFSQKKVTNINIKFSSTALPSTAQTIYSASDNKLSKE